MAGSAGGHSVGWMGPGWDPSQPGMGRSLRRGWLSQALRPSLEVGEQAGRRSTLWGSLREVGRVGLRSSCLLLPSLGKPRWQ